MDERLGRPWLSKADYVVIETAKTRSEINVEICDGDMSARYDSLIDADMTGRNKLDQKIDVNNRVDVNEVTTALASALMAMKKFDKEEKE